MGTSYRSSSASTRRISHPTLVPCVVSALPVSAPRGTFPPLPTHRSRLTPCSMVSISTPLSPVLASRTFALTSSVAPLSQSRRSSVMPSLTRAQLMRFPCRWLHPYPKDPGADHQLLQRQGAMSLHQPRRGCCIRRRCPGQHSDWRYHW